jgi:hypothetical protein
LREYKKLTLAELGEAMASTPPANSIQSISIDDQVALAGTPAA